MDGDVQMFFNRIFVDMDGDIWDTMDDLYMNNPLMVSDFTGYSSGYDFDFTRSILEKAKVFRDLFKIIEKQFVIHMVVVSADQLDWEYAKVYEGDYRLILVIAGGGKKLRFERGRKDATITLQVGSVVVLNDTGESFVDKDFNEPSRSWFLMLDATIKK